MSMMNTINALLADKDQEINRLNKIMGDKDQEISRLNTERRSLQRQLDMLLNGGSNYQVCK